jgi:hypothetical protein
VLQNWCRRTFQAKKKIIIIIIKKIKKKIKIKIKSPQFWLLLNNHECVLERKNINGNKVFGC